MSPIYEATFELKSSLLAYRIGLILILWFGVGLWQWCDDFILRIFILTIILLAWFIIFSLRQRLMSRGSIQYLQGVWIVKHHSTLHQYKKAEVIVDVGFWVAIRFRRDKNSYIKVIFKDAWSDQALRQCMALINLQNHQ